MAQVLGKVKIVAGGLTLLTKKGSKLNPGGIVRTPIVAEDGTVHYSETIKEATVDCVVIHVNQSDVLAIHAIKNATINFIGDNGKAYVVNNASSMEPPEINDDGEAPFKFFGDPAVAA